METNGIIPSSMLGQNLRAINAVTAEIATQIGNLVGKDTLDKKAPRRMNHDNSEISE